MRIKSFQNFPIGIFKDKHPKVKPGAEDKTVAQIADMEAKVSGKTKDLEKATKKLKHLATKDGLTLSADDTPVKPHGPAAELTLESEDLQNGAGITLDEVGIDDSIKLGEEIKIAEVTAAKVAVAPKAAPIAAVAAPAAVAPAEEKKEAKPDENESLNSLFSSDEVEENPLASLINSLPDVTARELMDDLAEIQRIIKEWRPSKK